MTEGPFYPDKFPLDTDNDLLIINEKITPAVGEISYLSGRVMDTAGDPVGNAVVEIWQVDNNAVYLHSGSMNAEKRDGNFQGYGRFLTARDGAYYFRTVKPVPYPGRTPHIHVAVNREGKRVLTTQLLINGHPQNESDGVFRNIQSPELRKLVLADFKPVPGSATGELEARFDIILGATPDDSQSGLGPRGGGGGPRERRTGG
jgi:protocatechuate 3,4-dioxygenase beta subunit